MKYLYCLLLFYVMVACNSNTIMEKPKNLISQDKMVAILTENYIGRGALNRKNIYGDKNINYLSNIYKNQNIDSVAFHQSLKYYVSDIRSHQEILKKVKQNIDKQLLQLENQQKDTLLGVTKKDLQ